MLNRRAHRNRPGHGLARSHERKRHFGATEILAPLIVEAGLDAGVSFGTGAAIADVAAPALIGAGVGAATSAATGGDPGIGALTGGVGGGAIGAFGGAGGVVDSATGLGAVGSDALVGAAAGAASHGITGGNPLTGALTGGASGALTGAMTPSGAPAGGATAGGASAVGGLAPAGAGAVDLTGGGAGIAAGSGDAINIASDLGLSPAGGSDGLSGLTNGSTLGNNVATGFGGAGGDPGGGFNLGSTSPSMVGGGAGTAGSGLTPTSGGGSSGAAPASGGFNYNTSTAGKIMNSLGIPENGVSDFVAKNPAAVIGGAGLAYNLTQNQNPQQVSTLSGQADQLSAQGKQLGSYLQNGTLPPGAQGAINQATAAAKASTRSKFASMGLAGSQQEQQALSQIDLQAQTQSFSIADKLLQQGIDETKLSSGIYDDLLKVNQQQTKDTGTAIANFATSIGGFGTPKVAGG